MALGEQMKMGETRVTVRLHGRPLHEDSSSLARELGITPNEAVRVELADGSRREASLADAAVEHGPSKRAVTVLVSPGDKVLPGVTTLEALRLKVNPGGRQARARPPYLFAM